MDNPTFLAAEQAARLKTTLTTTGEEHYDQVVAMSQGMINYAIKKMHQENPDMNVFDGSNRYGTISADLNESQLIIPIGETNYSTVIWRTNFKSGTFTARMEDGPDRDFAMDGWSVDVRVPLSFAVYDDNEEDSQAQRDENARKREWIADNFEVPGDYRPERLYAKMADARWQDIVFVGESFTVNGKPEFYPTWSKQKGNIDVADALVSCIKRVCVDREIQGLTTIGTKFSLAGSNAKPHEAPASYPPVNMIHQTMLYKLGPESGVVGWEKGEQTLADPGSRNCLLYCETVERKIAPPLGRRTLETKALPQKGIYATIGSSQDPTSRVEGTFALSHQLFFEEFLLPNLQGFVQESQIFPTQPKFENKPDGSYGASPNYYCGYNPIKDPHNQASNPIYKFDWVPAKNGVDAHYKAFVEVTQEAPLFIHPQKGEYSKFYGEGSPTVTVKWAKGGNRITIHGFTDYKSDGTTANHQNVDPGSHWLEPARSWWHDRFKMEWTMYIDVNARAGGLDMKVVHDREFVTVADHTLPPNGWEWNDPDTPNQIKRRIQKNMNEHLKVLKHNLNIGFDGQLKFIYPGNGQLDFKGSKFNDLGDLLAEIKYKDLPPGATKVIIPPVKVLKPHAQTEVKLDKVKGSAAGPEFRLKWTSSTPVTSTQTPAPVKPAPPPVTSTPAPGDDTLISIVPPPASETSPQPAPIAAPITPAAPKDTRAIFKLTGTNEDTKPVYLGKIIAVFEAQSNKSKLFSSVKFVAGPNGKQDQTEITVEVSPGTSPMGQPALDVAAKSSRWTVCTAYFYAQEGAIIVPPGGSITLIAKGATGNKDVTDTINLTEVWSDENGSVAATPLTFTDKIKFTLD